MAFLDNSGDIILDAVLTDTGRQRLAKGDGSFRITKFALGDDEINYSLYDKNNPSGSAYYDVELMQTPIFEAFSNNIASLNSRLMTVSRTNLMYLPILKINNLVTQYANQKIVQNGFILAVDEDTETFLMSEGLEYDSTAIGKDGILNGINSSNGKHVRIDQGIDNKDYPAALGLESDLIEIQYLFEIDNRFARLVGPDGTTTVQPSYIDDDDIAAYYVASDDSTDIVNLNTNTSDTNEIIRGARGTSSMFRLKSQLDVSSSDYLFDQLGTNVKNIFTGGTTSQFTSIKIISTSIRITGLTTGYSIDVPLVLIKAIN